MTDVEGVAGSNKLPSWRAGKYTEDVKRVVNLLTRCNRPACVGSASSLHVMPGFGARVGVVHVGRGAVSSIRTCVSNNSDGRSGRCHRGSCRGGISEEHVVEDVQAASCYYTSYQRANCCGYDSVLPIRLRDGYCAAMPTDKTVSLLSYEVCCRETYNRNNKRKGISTSSVVAANRVWSTARKLFQTGVYTVSATERRTAINIHVNVGRKRCYMREKTPLMCA